MANPFEKILSDAGEAIRQQVDWQVLAEALVDSGWYSTTLDKPLWMAEEYYEVKCWVDHSVTGKYQTRGNQWIFEREEDLTLFLLRWR